MRCVAIDWSGRATGAAQFIWIAEARDGELVILENGRDRRETVDWVVAAAQRDRDLVVGLDFAFSFPAWYCASRGWHTGPDVWRAIADEGEALLRDCQPPFWGRPGRPNPLSRQRGARATELAHAPGAKSVFQIGGAGAVGTGSIRGMPWLLALRDAGFAVWPFDAGGPPAVVEIYPRLMYGHGVRKRRAAERRALLTTLFSDQSASLRRRAAASEDAFDAAVSALVMSRRDASLARLPQRRGWELEGRVWTPTPTRGVSCPEAQPRGTRVSTPGR